MFLEKKVFLQCLHALNAINSERRTFGFLDDPREASVKEKLSQYTASLNLRGLSDIHPIGLVDFLGCSQIDLSQLRSNLPAESSVHRFFDIWEAGALNDKTYLMNQSLFEVAHTNWVVLDRVVYDVDELLQAQNQACFYRHPQNNMPFSDAAILQMCAHRRLFRYGHQLRNHRRQQLARLPGQFLNEIYKLLLTYLRTSSLATHGALVFNNLQLETCEAVKTQFFHRVNQWDPHLIEAVFKFEFHIRYEGKLPFSVTVGDVLQSWRQGGEGCIMVEQLHLWYLYVLCRPQCSFPREILDRREAWNILLPHGVSVCRYIPQSVSPASPGIFNVRQHQQAGAVDDRARQRP